MSSTTEQLDKAKQPIKQQTHYNKPSRSPRLWWSFPDTKRFAEYGKKKIDSSKNTAQLRLAFTVHRLPHQKKTYKSNILKPQWRKGNKAKNASQ